MSVVNAPGRILASASARLIHRMSSGVDGVRTLTPFCLLLLLRAGLDRGAVFEQVGVSVLDNVGKALMTEA